MNAKEEVRGQSLNYWRENAEENFSKTPLSVLKYITVLEECINIKNTKQSRAEKVEILSKIARPIVKWISIDKEKHSNKKVVVCNIINNEIVNVEYTHLEFDVLFGKDIPYYWSGFIKAMPTYTLSIDIDKINT